MRQLILLAWIACWLLPAQAQMQQRDQTPYLRENAETRRIRYLADSLRKPGLLTWLITATNAATYPCEAPTPLDWGLLSKNTYQEVHYPAINATLLCPDFPVALLEKDQTCIVTSGFISFIRSDEQGNNIVLFTTKDLNDFYDLGYSRILEVELPILFGDINIKNIPCRIQGTLELNDKDIDHHFFRITSTVILPAKTP